MYLHVFVIKRDSNSKKPEKIKFSGKHVTKATKQLNRFKKLKFTKTQNLLTGETAATPEEVLVSYFFIIVVKKWYILNQICYVVLSNYISIKFQYHP